ncbi:CHASE sensor domain-containing protein [Desulfococcaceae bacterium HSG8]|nr:CHASE sensor domain-containing protein [Desulfococcaceae bacterium HSG8]
MLMFQRLSIQRKLVIIIMLTSGVACLLGSVAFAVKDLIIYRHSLVKGLSGITQVVGINSEGALLFNDRITAEDNLAALRAMPYIFFACIYDNEGEVFATYRREDVSPDVSPPGHQESGHYFKKMHLGVLGGEYLFLFQPIHSEKEIIGTVLIQYDLEEMLFKMREAGIIFIVIMLLAFFVALMLSHRLQRIISDPILKLTQTAKTISKKKDFSARAMFVCHQDEIGILVDGFNEMLAEIQAQDIELKKHRENELKRQQQYLHR